MGRCVRGENGKYEVRRVVLLGEDYEVDMRKD